MLPRTTSLPVMAGLLWRAGMDLKTLQAAENVRNHLPEEDATVFDRAFRRAGRHGGDTSLGALAVVDPTGFDRMCALMERLDMWDATILAAAIGVAARSGHGLAVDDVIRVCRLTIDQVHQAVDDGSDDDPNPFP